MSRPLVVGLGELVWDLLPDCRTPGGAPANFAFHVAQLGGQAAIVSAVGEDHSGDQLLDWIKTAGVDPAHIQRTDRSTGTVSVSLSESGQPQYQIHPDVAWDHLAWTPSLANLAKQADCVCVGSLGQRSPVSRKTIQQFLRATSPAALRIFDVNLRDPHHDPSVIAETVGLANILKLNQDEWSFVARQFSVSTDWSVGLKQLIDATQLRLIAMTRGAHGSVLVDKDGMHQLEAEPIEIADTVGAGDAFTAAMAMGLLRNNPIATIQQTAATAASFVCTQSGATPAFPAASANPNGLPQPAFSPQPIKLSPERFKASTPYLNEQQSPAMLRPPPKIWQHRRRALKTTLIPSLKMRLFHEMLCLLRFVTF